MDSLAERAAQFISRIDALVADGRDISVAHRWPEIRTLIEDLVAAKERAEADADRLAEALWECSDGVYIDTSGAGPNNDEVLRLHDEAVAQR